MTSPPKPKSRLKKRLAYSLLGLTLILLVAGVWSYFAFAWIFFVEPVEGVVQLGHPISVVAGNGEEGFRDGKGAEARMNKPIRLAPLDEDTVVFADINNHAIRTLDADGEVRTLAGGPTMEGHLDGPARDARFDSPHGVAVRSDGAIAVAEASGNTVRLLAPIDQDGEREYTVTTLGGVPGESGMRDGPAGQALFDAPHAVAWGARGELYVADIGNARLRMIENGMVTTLAGGDETGATDGALGTGTLKYPMDIAVDESGAVWIADAGTLTVRRWRASTGLDTPFADLEMAMPHGIAVLPEAVIVAELYGHRLLRIDRESGELAAVCGTTEGGMNEGELNKPAAILSHAGLLWIADLGNHRIVTCPQTLGS